VWKGHGRRDLDDLEMDGTKEGWEWEGGISTFNTVISGIFMAIW
jgi:hypothetical protein